MVDLTNPTISSISPRRSDEFFREEHSKPVECRVERADQIMHQEQIDRVDFVKIDVEGHELSVLRGFGSRLKCSESRPRVIQFEYGETDIPFGSRLFQMAELLKWSGYVFGRIYPNHINFKEYEYVDEHFRMGNYVAVQSDDKIREKLAG